MYTCCYTHAQTLIARGCKHQLYSYMLLRTHFESAMNIAKIFVGPSYIFIVRSLMFVIINYYNIYIHLGIFASY